MRPDRWKRNPKLFRRISKQKKTKQKQKLASKEVARFPRRTDGKMGAKTGLLNGQWADVKNTVLDNEQAMAALTGHSGVCGRCLINPLQS